MRISKDLPNPDHFEKCQSCLKSYDAMTKVDIGKTRPWSFYLCSDCKDELKEKL
ncbi:hypothetical protein LCGC14_0196320 [marine sediment metagenome]|uniref:Uncharacterized protein n=1 Tax=marine sediment metagenome TaxID=412755 RepID=A0A0F9UQ75_9ZZZZ